MTLSTANQSNHHVIPLDLGDGYIVWVRVPYQLWFFFLLLALLIFALGFLAFLVLCGVVLILLLSHLGGEMSALNSNPINGTK